MTYLLLLLLRPVGSKGSSSKRSAAAGFPCLGILVDAASAAALCALSSQMLSAFTSFLTRTLTIAGLVFLYLGVMVHKSDLSATLQTGNFYASESCRSSVELTTIIEEDSDSCVSSALEGRVSQTFEIYHWCTRRAEFGFSNARCL